MRTIPVSDDGFTLLEVMAVTLILAILVSVAVGSYVLTAGTSRRISCAAQQRVVSGAVIQYQEAHDGMLPVDLSQVRPYASRDAYDRCPNSASVYYEYDQATGRVTCPAHAPQ